MNNESSGSTQNEYRSVGSPQQAAGVTPVAPKRRRTGLIITLVIIGGFLMLFIIGGIISSAVMGVALGGGSSKSFNEEVVIKGIGELPDKIAIISVTGPIGGVGSYASGEGMVQKVADRLRTAAKDDRVKAVLLQMDSPGGGLTASDILHNEIVRVQEAGKPVVVFVGMLAASGGLYISAPADYILATPTAMIGSIGVIMARFKMKELIRKLGIDYDPIKSSEMKDIGSPFRDLSQSERAYFEDLINSFNDRFISIVAEGRKLEESAVRALANGKIYTADQALGYKLIDQIGYFDDALAKTKQIAGLDQPQVIKYVKHFDKWKMISALLEEKTSFGINMKDLRNLIMEFEGTPQVMALWTGGLD